VAIDALDDVASGSATARSTAWLRRLALDHVLAAGRRATDAIPGGDLVGRVVGNAAQAGRAGPLAVRTFTNLIPAIGGPVALALIDPWLCVTFAAGVPILLLLLRALAREATDVSERYLESQGEIAGRLTEALGGIRTIAAAGTLEREADRVLEPLADLRRHGFAVWGVQMRIAAQDGLLVALLEVAVIGVAGVELAHGRITVGELLAAAQYALLGATMTSALGSVTALGRVRGAASRIAEVLAIPAVAHGEAVLPDGPGRLELRGITVRRDGREVLRAVDLDVPPGALVAIAGASGSGKSLLAAVAGRLMDPDEGEVRLDGVPLPHLDRYELRRAIGYGFEQPALIGTTLAEAIGFGAEAPEPGHVVAAARAARAEHFVRPLRLRFRTPLDEVPMSTGERQRIGLARTFAHAGRVLILDDVAASLDTVTEHHIGLVLTTAFADRTRLVVAQRASTAARADLVVWLDDGAVRAVGTHAELWREPDYRALFGAVEPAAANGNGNGVATWTA
jgi:ATP-binding cassette subfamily B protein